MKQIKLIGRSKWHTNKQYDTQQIAVTDCGVEAIKSDTITRDQNRFKMNEKVKKKRENLLMFALGSSILAPLSKCLQLHHYGFIHSILVMASSSFC